MKINLMKLSIFISSGMLIYETGLALLASQTVNAPNIWESMIDDLNPTVYEQYSLFSLVFSFPTIIPLLAEMKTVISFIRSFINLY